MLVDALNHRGIKTHKLWLRSLHTLAFIISKIAMKLLHLKDVYEFRSKYSYKQPLRSLWYGIELVSILPLVFSKMFIPLKLGDTVVAERFVVDWIVSLSYVTRNEVLLNGALARLVLGLIPKESLIIYVDATADAIRARGRKEDSFEFIEFQRKSYTKLARLINAITIDTSDKNLHEVHKLILELALGNSLTSDTTRSR